MSYKVKLENDYALSQEVTRKIWLCLLLLLTDVHKFVIFKVKVVINYWLLRLVPSLVLLS
jgi:hypothetical protein